MLHVLAEISDPKEKSAICETVLRALPQWFGIEASLMDYVRQVAGLPFFAALDVGSGQAPAGFAAVKAHTPYAAEVCVMGVLPQHHRSGLGRMLVEACEKWCRAQGIPYLTVKTLADSHPDPGYAETRRFYGAMGFVPVEVFPDLWGPHNPCLLLLKRLGLQ